MKIFAPSESSSVGRCIILFFAMSFHIVSFHLCDLGDMYVCLFVSIRMDQLPYSLLQKRASFGPPRVSWTGEQT